MHGWNEQVRHKTGTSCFDRLKLRELPATGGSTEADEP